VLQKGVLEVVRIHDEIVYGRYERRVVQGLLTVN